MDKLGHRLQRRDRVHFFFQEILNRFDVVVGGAFDGLDALRVFFAEFRDDLVEESVCVGVKSRNFFDFCTGGQFLQPTYFNLHAEFQQTVFAENGAQCADFITVASING